MKTALNMAWRALLYLRNYNISQADKIKTNDETAERGEVTPFSAG
jgi:hypothetical protein